MATRFLDFFFFYRVCSKNILEHLNWKHCPNLKWMANLLMQKFWRNIYCWYFLWIAMCCFILPIFSHLLCFGKFIFYTRSGFQHQICVFSDVFWCDLNDSDNYFCRKSFVVTPTPFYLTVMGDHRWETGVMGGRNQCHNRPTQNPWFPPVVA